MLSLTAKGVIQGLNPRVEKTAEKTLACDIKLHMLLTNQELAEFHPALRAKFYKPKDVPQQELEALFSEAPDSAIVFPAIKEIHWDQEFYHCDVNIVPPISKMIELGDCKIQKVVFAMQEGGIVLTTLQVQAHPTAGIIARLCELLGFEIDVSIEQKEFKVPGASTTI